MGVAGMAGSHSSTRTISPNNAIGFEGRVRLGYAYIACKENKSISAARALHVWNPAKKQQQTGGSEFVIPGGTSTNRRLE